ncbi:MAG TPA: ABC transporter substrate-binding protein [Stellaceae bacterium]|nr:ABC transporter substrate-binding protein [Stellaceae bacterium]
MRIIADESQDGVAGYYSDEAKVRTDSGIARIEDLKGKVLATTGFGAASDIALRAMLTRHGLNPAMSGRSATTIATGAACPISTRCSIRSISRSNSES